MTWNPSRKTLTPSELAAWSADLLKRMQGQGLTAAALARKAFGTDASGRARDRDKVSLYLHGKGFPGEEKRRALAVALGCSLDELTPPAPKWPRPVRDLL